MGGVIRTEGESAGVREQVIVGSFGQHGGQVVLLHLGGSYFPGGWL